MGFVTTQSLTGPPIPFPLCSCVDVLPAWWSPALPGNIYAGVPYGAGLRQYPFPFLFGLYESSHWLVMLANILSKAEAKADQQRTEENAVATAERKAEVMKGASDVQQTVSHMPDDDVDRELHEHFTRPGSR